MAESTVTSLKHVIFDASLLDPVDGDKNGGPLGKKTKLALNTSRALGL